MDILCSVELMRLIVGWGVAEVKCKVTRMNMMTHLKMAHLSVGKISFWNHLRPKDMHAHLFSAKMKENIFGL